MALQRYGFIVKSADLEVIKHHAFIKSEQFEMMVAGVNSVEMAIMAVQEMLTREVQLVELCGGFSAEDSATISEAINDLIPIGRVQYSDEERARLAQALA
ncbi:hypothetical protein DV711_00015 [Motiliproteus coralliicola]|uniref:Uncharacterized protein n=1 Tax=Motiliproteus coralliicola TaxID=2283196 RepID=A0A369WQQ8_9GAMM|nr:DUF6506 family protein [Motiliproteus coralliicola]RDE24032.1 hypothetical protein DV711_00015 [Motiliproteus coralliicola]